MSAPILIEHSQMAEIPASLALPVPEGTAPTSLSVEAEGGECLFASRDATDRVSLLDRALLSWLVATRQPVALTREALAPCEGLPPIASLAVPATGWAIGLTQPAESVEAAGALAVRPIGDDGRWWFVTGDGNAQLAFMHGQDPPTRFLVRFDEALPAPGDPHLVPKGAALGIDLREGPSAPSPARVSVVLASDAVASVRISGPWLVAVGAAAGSIDGVLRIDDRPPEPLHIEVTAALPPSDSDVIVPAGKRRRLALDATPDEVWSADPSVLDAVQSGLRVTLEGRSPGRTHLVIRQGTELFLVPVAVGH